MMNENTINLLPTNIANKIAAGEVVQRPESVVKELLENSIDAGAKNIDLIIKQAGKNLIQVVDDGSGMTEEDATLCVQRHATSKIRTIEDLDMIKTFGFRGEALSSIAAVSRFELKTEKHNEEIGTLIRIEGDNNIHKEKGSFNKGTSIAIKNLFFNVPARRNFLKTNATELKHIIETFKKISLSYPEINFKFYNDNNLLFDFSSGNINDRIKSIFGDNILDSLIEVNEPTDFISVRGFVAKPAFLRKNKGEQYLFINKRFVVSKIINHSVFRAYENIIEKGDYPFFILFVELNPSKIDINVHPTKLEVKFDNERDVYSFILAVIKKSIGSYDLVPKLGFNTDTQKEKLQYKDFSYTGKNDFSDRPNFVNNNQSKKLSGFSDEDIDQLFDSINPEIKNNISQNNISSDDFSHPFENEITEEKNIKEVYHISNDEEIENNKDKYSENSSFIISLHNKYILSQIKSGLMVIDAHVAHERILYEKAIKSFDANMPFSQQLLFSQTHQIDVGDLELLKELNPFLTKLGFEIKFFGTDTIVIDGVPSDIKMGSEVDVLMEILNDYKENQLTKNIDIREKMAASFACKAAIKAGDKLTEKEMRLLVDQLFATSMPYVCPHGRPIVVKIPLEEFDKRFGRT